jgi:FemAB-related protein (PEP-CTERM system-associated)
LIRVRPAGDGDGPRWDRYVGATRGSHFGQRFAWGRLVERQYGCVPRYFVAEDEDGGVHGVLPLFEKRGRHPTLFSAPGGLLADDDAIAAALLAPARDFVARGGFEYLELRDQRRAWPGLETSEEHVTLVLTLESSEEAQWAAFDAKLRNQVRKAQRSGFTVRWGHEQLGDFHRVLLENMRDLGTPLRGPGYFRAVLDALDGDADVLVIDRGGVPAGAMFLVRHGGGAADPWASSLRRMLAWCPNHMLYWEAIRRAIALGSSEFDFGRSQWNSNTFRFKEQWSAVPVPLYYQYVLGRAAHIPTLAGQKSAFDAAVRVWKRLPLPVARALGEPVKRLFPEVL